MFRVSGVFAVVGWLLVQVAGALESAIGLPEWFDGFVIATLIIAFPVTMIVTWAFELTPEGIKRTRDAAGPSSGKPFAPTDAAILVGLAIVIGLGVWQQMTRPAPVPVQNTETAQSIEEPPVSQQRTDVVDASIAVLPFADLSPEGDQEYFSDGISEEILNVLVRIEDLKVASRTSSFGFKGQAELGIPGIAEKLGVRHVLEGSVRKAGETVRVTAQLIDAQTDAHLWSETYDRTLTTENIFAIQDEIAKAIVDQLGLMIGDPKAQPTLRETATDNLDAYSMYLKAQGLFHRRSAAVIPEIVTLYESAVELDPNFAQAWAGLAATYAIVPGWQLGTVDEYHAKAREAADRASALDDRLALPYAVRGSLASDSNDKFRALEHFAAALERDPEHLQTHYFRGALLFDAGFLTRAENDFRQCLEIDPAYEICRRFLAFALLFTGREDEAASLFETSMMRGQRSWNHTFAGYYAAIGNESALSHLLVAANNNNLWQTEPQFRLFTDKSYSVEAFMADLRSAASAAGAENRIGEHFDSSDFEPVFDAGFFWNPYHGSRLRPDLLDGTADEWRKTWMIRRGMVDLWRQIGFPPQCRPVGKDDFWCEGFPEDEAKQ